MMTMDWFLSGIGKVAEPHHDQNAALFNNWSAHEIRLLTDVRPDVKWQPYKWLFGLVLISREIGRGMEK